MRARQTFKCETCYNDARYVQVTAIKSNVISGSTVVVEDIYYVLTILSVLVTLFTHKTSQPMINLVLATFDIQFVDVI